MPFISSTKLIFLYLGLNFCAGHWGVYHIACSVVQVILVRLKDYSNFMLKNLIYVTKNEILKLSIAHGKLLSGLILKLFIYYITISNLISWTIYLLLVLLYRPEARTFICFNILLSVGLCFSLPMFPIF